ncbi:MAG: phosphorylase [Chloroflexi bacterium]|nr:phosphorylase [Chloroflexota bacterium]MCI0578915.1 phosphorylase [Chloroflexota bacterium]MCI0647542.1 phosphorylase [Chloroflexota bacterium]MCI0730853.1 phosphorylase [Chloroflexota bacterium]
MLEPRALWARVQEQTRRALRSGALRPIATTGEIIEQGGIRFLVRVSANLARRARATQEQKEAAPAGGKADPFLPPYEEALFIGPIADSHVCLLNKYNVIGHHLLIVSRAFEEQESLLTLADFRALWTCLAGYDGLAFYNGGRTAGASQAHKHLQLVPLPLAQEGPPLPVAPALAASRFDGLVGTTPAFPFRHAVARLDPAWTADPQQAAQATLERYDLLLRAVGLPPGDAGRQPGPYNLLLTRQLMWLVPRSREKFEKISINALAYAGSFFVSTEEKLQLLKEHGPMTVLQHVGISVEMN